MPLTMDLMVEDGVSCPLDEGEMQRVCELVLTSEQVTRPCFLSLSIVSDEAIRQANLEWRGIDAPTDVVSLECERPDDPDLFEGEPCELGDIFLAPAYIERQAARFGTTPPDEMRLMLIHGMLHLLGYDHVEEQEAELMEAREDELLALAGLRMRGGHVALTRHQGGDEG